MAVLRRGSTVSINFPVSSSVNIVCFYSPRLSLVSSLSRHSGQVGMSKPWGERDPVQFPFPRRELVQGGKS